jgi:hypothetical protein
MTVVSALAAAPFKHPLSHPPTAVWAALLMLFGLASGALGWFGWHRVDRVVPTSLPEDMRRQRSTVIRRGSAFFFVVGVVLVAMGIYTATG